jgi:hypothetical protein
MDQKGFLFAKVLIFAKQAASTAMRFRGVVGVA